MRTLGLSLCLVACTLENPAFHTTQTDVTAASTASTLTDGSASTTATAPTTSASTATTTSGPDMTSGPSGTTMNLSDTDATTGPPATTSTTDPPMTASSDPGDSSTTTGGPMMCAAFEDPLGPFLVLESAVDFVPILTVACAQWQQSEFTGRLQADASSFSIHPDPQCGANNVPGPALRFELPVPDNLAAKGKCVSFRFHAHPGYEMCTVSDFTVWVEDKPGLVGSFGRAAPPPNSPLQVTLGPKNLCECDGCCGAQMPDPDAYKFVINGVGVGEGAPQEFEVMAIPFVFLNLRSHVHAPECMNANLPPPDWLHLDWVAAQVY